MPKRAVLPEPIFKLQERLGFQGVEASLSIRSHRNEVCVREDAEVAGDAGLVNPGFRYQVTHLLLPLPQRLDDPTARRIGERLENV